MGPVLPTRNGQIAAEKIALGIKINVDLRITVSIAVVQINSGLAVWIVFVGHLVHAPGALGANVPPLFYVRFRSSITR
jgi:hypothetical protein